MTVGSVPASHQQADQIEIRFIDSGPAFETVKRIRAAVFRDEQQLVDLSVEDQQDPLSVQVVAYVNGRAAGCARLTPAMHGREAFIAWVATLPKYRQLGVATEMVRTLCDVADRAGMPVVALSAQTHAQAIYERLGFAPTEPPFTLRGIPHVMMARRRAASNQ